MKKYLSLNTFREKKRKEINIIYNNIKNNK